MNISIKLVQFEADRYAICEATVEQAGRRVSVYGMAMAGEPGRIVELAQSRALQLAQQLIQQGPAALSANEFPVPSAAITAGHEPTTPLDPEPLPTWSLEETAPVTTVEITEEGSPEVAEQPDNVGYSTETDPAGDALPVEEQASWEEPAGSTAADAADLDAVVNIPW